MRDIAHSIRVTLHPEFLSTAIPSGCLTPGILFRRHSIRVSHTRNPSPPPFHPGVSHPEFFSAAISSGCLTPGILLRRHSIRVSHTRNSSPPPFHPGVSPPESFSAAIPSGCLTSGIFLRRHFIRMSHPQNSSPSTFHPGCLTSGILPGRRSTFLGYLASGILSADVPPFSPSLEHFLEVPKIPFSINLAAIFFSASNFRFFFSCF